MGKECTMLEILKLPKQDDDEDELEMSLELSIGGSYAKKSNSKDPKKLGENNNSSDSSFENGCNSMDLRKRKEIQALRRQEARRKRELKLKKSSNLGFLEGDDKLLLEARKLQARVEDREIREKSDRLSAEFSRKKDGFSREFPAKRETIDLNLSLSTVNDNKKNNNGVQGLCLYPPQVQHGYAWMKGNNLAAHQSGNSSLECDNSEQQSNNGNLKRVSNNNNNGSLEQSSSMVSDYHSKGGSNSDTGSHSSRTGPHQLQNTLQKSPLHHPETNRLSSQTEPNHITIASSSTGLVETSPKPTNNNNLNASQTPRMPCVTTTGNGPNGKTINGILYQYTQAQVSIMCVCHGSSFSPAGFVEHAGGVDVSNPLRHITIVHPR